MAQDEWDKYKVQDQSLQDEWSQYVVKDTQSSGEESSKQGMLPTIAGIGTGVAALGGVAYGAKRLNNYMQAPKKLLSPIESELNSMQQKIPSMQGMRYQDIPGRIQNQIAESRLQIKDFDELALSTSAENLASSVKSAYPKLRESNFTAYGNTLKNGESLMEQAGKKLNTTQFDNEVIQKSIEDSIKDGVPEEQLAKLKRLSSRDLSQNELKILGIRGEKRFQLKDLTLTQAKGYLKNITKDLPGDTQRAIVKNWGTFLEKNAPPEVATDLASANQKYTDFLKQDKALRKLIDPKTGDYDYDKLYRYTLQRAKTRINSDFKNLMEGISKIDPEVGINAKDLYSMRAKRIEMQRRLNSLRTWLTKAEELVSKRAALLEKYPMRLKGAGKLVGNIGMNVGKKILTHGLMGVGLGAIDPTGAVMNKEFGTSNPLEVIDRAMGKQPTEEQFKQWLQNNIA